MIGGSPAAVEHLRPIFESLAPAPDRGWAHMGPSGAGHFAKMVHNGIEYGMMQSFAEGFALLEKKKEFGFDLAKVAETWRHGSVVRSWLLDLTADALQENPTLKGIGAQVADSGEGRWMVAEAIASDVPCPVITLSLIERIRSRVSDSFGNKMLAIMRNKFGGHAIQKVLTPWTFFVSISGPAEFAALDSTSVSKFWRMTTRHGICIVMRKATPRFRSMTSSARFLKLPGHSAAASALRQSRSDASCTAFWSSVPVVPPLTPVFTWLDTTAPEGIEAVRRKLGARFHERTGCHYHPMFPVFKLAARPPGRGNRVGSPKAWLAWELTGSFVDDFGMASASGLLDVQEAEVGSGTSGHRGDGAAGLPGGREPCIRRWGPSPKLEASASASPGNPR